MSLRDLFVFAVVLGSLPYCLTRPFYGLLMFSWLAYMRPHDLCWGPARSFRFSLYVAICMFVGWIVFEKRPFLRRFANINWLLLLLLFVTASLFFNEMLWPEVQIRYFIDLLKVFAVALFTTGLVDSKRRLDLLMWTIALSLGFYGIKVGLFGLAGGRVLQGPGGMMQDNNAFALAMAMNVPFLYYLGGQSKDWRVRRFCQVTVFLSMVTIVVTTSRGGMLTLAAVLMLLILKSRQRLIAIPFGALILVAGLALLPADVWKRLQTLKDPTEESSAAGRLYAWGVSMRMIKDNPLLGVGFENYLAQFRRYDPIPADDPSGVGSVRVAHNSYLEIWAESGTPALLSFLAAIGTSLWMMRKLRRRARARDGPSWIGPYTHLVEVSFCAYLVGGTFLSKAHYDLSYHLIAIAAALWLVGNNAIRERLEERFRGGEPEPVAGLATSPLPPAFGAPPRPSHLLGRR